MKVLMVGSGAREHALAWKISQSPLLTQLFAAPGNAGIAKLAECIQIEADDVKKLHDFALSNKIDLTIVGPEVALAAGIVDVFQKSGLAIFGPSQEAAKLESSKAFSKSLMSEFNIPTADYEIFSNINEAKHYVIETEMPVVIKADGLAAGKGVVICHSSKEAVAALSDMMEKKIFGDAGQKVVVERVLEGEELSVLALTDGEKIIPLASSQDHKRVYDHDKGPNTGGMGAYSPCPFVSDLLFQEIVAKTIKPMVQGMASKGIKFRGVLYAGIMLTKEGPMVLEYNCRFGDPETQVILPRLKSDLLPVLAEIANGTLSQDQLEWHPKACVGVVVASGGYPGAFEKGFPISGLDHTQDVMIFHAGTSFNASGQTVTSGGRVLSVCALGDSLRDARDRAYAGLSHIRFQNSFHRRDIAKRALEVLR